MQLPVRGGGFNSKTLIDSSLFNIHGQLVRLQYPSVMGILNLSQNSFYSGSLIKNEFDLTKKINEHLEAGVDILDLGAASTRPGSPLVDAQEEIRQLIPAFKIIKKYSSTTLISIDTMNASTAERLLQEGADIINDVSGAIRDVSMLEVVARHNVPFIAMHMRGVPETMQNEENLRYEDLVSDLIQYFARRKREYNSSGVHQIILDPGFGFSKTLEQNYELLSKLDLFRILDCPILVGLSRKSMITKVLQIGTDEALSGSLVLATIALMKSANILRVHDVLPTRQAVTLFQKLTKDKS